MISISFLGRLQRRPQRHPRARRQVPAHHLRRRRSEERGEGRADGQLPDAGRGLLQRHQGLRAEGNLRQVRQGANLL